MNGEAPLERIDETGIDEEMRSSYIDYSMSVIVGRALPDVRDGLKPVHRRVLFAMREQGNTPTRPYRKSARIVGDVIGKYHPHGDMAVYDTMVRMAQPFSMRYPLVDGQGNFGSIDGDPPAAMRYTEVRMDRLAEELLADIDKETVDFGPNYDESLEQPLVLPSRFPNLLINGSTGIAVGMATNIPPHNMSEVIDALVHLIENPKTTVKELMQYVKGPDFPTGGIVCGLKPIEEMYTTGRGQMKVRGRAYIEELKGGKEVILISELPYTVNKAKLIESIAKLVQEKKIEGISDIRDESNKEGIRVVIELKKSAVAKVILNKIYKLTQLEITFGAILLALDDGRPRTMNLKEIMQRYLAHRLEVVRRRCEYELRKAEARAHILEGLKIALDNLDEVVKTIRSARSREDARVNLMKRFNLSEAQAKAILDMRLYQLTGLEREKVEEEYLELIKYISYLKDLLSSDAKLFGVVRDELVQVKNTYGDQRRTDIAPEEGEINVEDLIANRGCIITVTHAGYIKRVPTGTYRSQKRGGKGVAGMTTREEDFVQHVFTANTHDYILFFTAKGRVYWEKVYEIPEASRTARGKAIVNLLNIQGNDSIASLIKVQEFNDDKHLVMATKNGVIKKTNLSAFSNPRKDGVIGIRVDGDDQLIGVKLTGGSDEVMLASTRGMSVRFKEDELRDMGRATRGVRGISLSQGDTVKTVEIVDPSETFFVCTEKGYGKRTAFEQYRLQKRGGKGIIAVRLSEKTGSVVSAHTVAESDALMMITGKGKMIRIEAKEVSMIGRATQGVRLINLGEGDKLVSATPFEPAPEDEAMRDQDG